MRHDAEQSALFTDMTPKAKARYLERIRATPPREKLERALRLSEMVRSATMTDVRRQNPGASEDEIASAFIRRVYGDKLADRFSARRRR
ncbi:MAG: hypothetical protein DI536_31030 [Archangium gephyra]|uniref:Uncharacterized protein n=1 Tax=Archangium gephyra TaxID=48 RepID=A0A2W5UAR3_9BACT|nr:MAG: hypothetical protein DI536_31030 [Archangium gephyra]